MCIKNKKTSLIRAICCLFLLGVFLAADAIIVKDIKVNGLHKIRKSTFLENLSIKKKDEFNPSMSSKIIRGLYQKEFFDSIQLSQKGNTLVFDVVERPVISSIHFHGNNEVPNDAFSQALKSAGLIKGRMFDHASLEAIEQSLKTQYAIRGRRGVFIDTSIEKLPRNRVKVEINIDEGSSNEIRHIRIIGNKNISTNKLMNELPISSQGLFTYFTQSDKYSEEKVNHALQKIKDYYQDRGYAKVDITSANVGKLPNINHVKIVIKINEGDIYTIKDYRFTGNIVIPVEILDKHVTIKKGEQYSRKALSKIVEDLSSELNDRGYTFSVIDVQPEIDDKTKEMLINFHINPGRPIYVRRIIFVGNHKTSDYVLRRELLQEEGSLLSVRKVKESKRKMRNLRYIQDVQEDTQQVFGTNNQVDMVFTVSESGIAEFQGQAGISSTGFEVKVGINHYNVFGSGRTAGINFKHDSWGQNVSLDYYNPYYTESGIGRGFNLFYSRSSISKSKFSTLSSNQFAQYTLDSFGSSMRYNIPLTDTNSVNWGITLKKSKLIRLGDSDLINQFQKYIDRFGTEYYGASLNAGWSYSNYDQFPFPNAGLNISLFGSLNYPIGTQSGNNEVGEKIRTSGRFYKLGNEVRFYQPLFGGLILGIAGSVKFAGSYASKEVIPFFEYYKAGGASYEGQVRGFETASLGPKSKKFQQAMGGNFLVNSTAALIFPEPLSGKSFRSSLFYDAGNVYQKNIEDDFKGEIKAGKIRTSIGFGIEWLTPFGPIKLSFAYALNAEQNDKISIPALSFQTGF